MKKALKYTGLTLVILFIAGICYFQQPIMPVMDATPADWNPKSFWYYPWGRSVTHKGVDIFAKKGNPVISATSGLVVYSGIIGMGGQVVLVLGPGWRFHYYAHLDTITCKRWQWVSQGSLIGEVGNSGNAKGKPPHLHYSVVSSIPLPWRIDDSKQGWKKMFYLNPTEGIKF